MLSNTLSLAVVAVASLALVSPAQAQDPLWTTIRAVPDGIRSWEAERQRDDPSITRSEFVQLDLPRLRALRRETPGAADRFRLDLPTGPTTVRIHDLAKTYRHDVFHGVVGVDERFTLVVNTHGAATAAKFWVGDVLYTINSTTRDDVWVLRTNDLSLLPQMPCGTDESHVIEPPRPAGNPPAAPASSGRTIVDVIVFYTRNVRTDYGSTAAAQAEMALAIASANRSCVESGVDIEYRMVLTDELQYGSVGDSRQDLQRFRSTNDVYMARVHGVRRTHGADMMALVARGGAICGIAYLMRPSSPGFGPNAFSVTVRQCLRGGTLTHELGHNQGCAHDRQNAGGGAWSYSFGWRTPPAWAYRTVMAYAPGNPTDFWSNPNINFRGYVMGTSRDNNARGLNNSKNHIHDFWPTRTIEWCDIDGGIAGNGGKPILRGSGTVDNAVPIELAISNTLLGAPGVLVIGGRRADQPLFGGTLVPNVVITLSLLGSTDDITVPLAALSSQPRGADFYLQSFFLDASAPQGLSGSDAIKVVIP